MANEYFKKFNMNNFRTTIRLSILNLLLLFAFLIVAKVLEGCTVQVESEPVVVEEVTLSVEVTATLNCDQYSVADYLSTEVCEEYDFDECCNLKWDEEGCWISFCDRGCIGLTPECYGVDEDE